MDRSQNARIAIASSGLGHAPRGVETWAMNSAAALRAAGLDVTLFQGWGVPKEPWHRTAHCLRRMHPLNRTLVRALRPWGGWRVGLGSVYDAEQTTFALNLWPRVRRSFDLVHVQDPTVALILDKLQQYGLSKPKVILGHGTNETVAFLHRFPYLQHLSPENYDLCNAGRPAAQKAFMIPNFVDCGRFCPGDRAEARKQWGFPADALVVLSVAAINNTQKRIGYLIEEFARFLSAYSGDAILAIAGATELGSPELIEYGKRTLGDRVRFLTNLPQISIVSLLRAADIFALASLLEAGASVALMEALASGLPAVCHNSPTLEWAVGPAGVVTDLSRGGALAEALLSINDAAVLKALSRQARTQAERQFSAEAVVPQMRAMYNAVLDSACEHPTSRVSERSEYRIH